MLYIGVDLGTSAVKLLLMDSEGRIQNIVSREYPLYFPHPGWSEQKPEDWYEQSMAGLKELLSECDKSKVAGISFGGQMHGLVILDSDDNVIRPALLWNDGRTYEECDYLNNVIGKDKLSEYTANISFTGFTAPKILWVKNNEPQNFSKVYKWLDVKEYLIARMTGEFVMTHDSAFSTMIYDIKKKTWSKQMCDMLGVDMNHLAKIVKSTDKVGELTEKAAKELGLEEGTAVFGGGGDASLIGVGAGAVELGDTHIYQGTSGWVSTVVDKSIVDTASMIAAIVGAKDGYYNYFAELETAGKCVEWVKDHLALDEIDIYLDKSHDLRRGKGDIEKVYTNLFEYMAAVISEVPAGSNGVIFTPWLHGNRCPFEDPNARGMFFNISLDTGKSEMIRAVYEGVCFHLRWFLETQEKKIQTSKTLRFVGGGALSDVTCQILADCTGRTVETVDSPQNIGAVGAAITIAVGTGIIDDITQAKKLIPAAKTFIPDYSLKSVYDRNYEAYVNLYKSNKKIFALLNG